MSFETSWIQRPSLYLGVNAEIRRSPDGEEKELKIRARGEAAKPWKKRIVSKK